MEDSAPMRAVSGCMYKWTNHIYGWEPRWFIIDTERGMLKYFKTRDTSQNPRGAFLVSRAEVPHDGDEEDEGQFTIYGVNSAVFYVRARNASERNVWIEALRAAADVASKASSENVGHLARLPETSGHSEQPSRPTGTAGASVEESTAAVHQRLVEAGAYRNLLVQQLHAFVDTYCDKNREDAAEAVRVIETTSGALERSLDQALSTLRQRGGDGGYYRPTTKQWGPRSLDGLGRRANEGSEAPNASRLSGTHEVGGVEIGDATWGAKKGRLAIGHSQSEHGTSTSDQHSSYAGTSSSNSNGGRGVGGVGSGGNESSTCSSDDDEFYDAQDSGDPVPRRKISVENLPDRSSDEEASGDSEQKSVILHLIGQLRIGMDLTKVTLPTFILERRSLLEMYGDFFAHPDKFASLAQPRDPYHRFMKVLDWYLTSFHSGRKSSHAKKPYNPVLGETFDCTYQYFADAPRPSSSSSSSGGAPVRLCSRAPVPQASPAGKIVFYAEQTSHHPPISAFYAESQTDEHLCSKVSLNAHIWTKSKFLGLSVAVENIGQGAIRLHEHDEEYIVTFPAGYARSILSIPWVELGGHTRVDCAVSGYSAAIRFHTKPTFGGKANRISCTVTHKSEPKKVLAEINGEWNGKMTVKETQRETGESVVGVFADVSTLHTARKFVCPLEHQLEHDSRRVWREVTAALRAQSVDRATAEKRRIEEHQRALAKARKESGEEWQTRHFHKDAAGHWQYDNRAM